MTLWGSAFPNCLSISPFPAKEKNSRTRQTHLRAKRSRKATLILHKILIETFILSASARESPRFVGLYVNVYAAMFASLSGAWAPEEAEQGGAAGAQRQMALSISVVETCQGLMEPVLSGRGVRLEEDAHALRLSAEGEVGEVFEIFASAFCARLAVSFGGASRLLFSRTAHFIRQPGCGPDSDSYFV